ncbi:hypothetical protein CORC01_02796 [Colletotrichum orchidophilum]|uniref:Uncharacterized protein n=1 Tax=Colletotrichum orchidophilum TaxID=1209926 RepID=A0A1G4BKT9_9PEZI|nr:uncharacterized protein CORC01_02796 [Colletotrichum orchidophilum]OHF01918.1 hypothetical protein CORC01_02796 [Colletotrichum orchidophilum]
MDLHRSVAISNRRALDACAGSATELGFKQRAIQRREAKLMELREKRAISMSAPIRRRSDNDLNTLACLCTFMFNSSVSTCAVVPEILINAWHCNATGVYSGVSATGHHTSRATHIQVKTTAGATVLDNDTNVDGTKSYLGQLFFDQTLISAVDAVAPYNTNQQELTLNSDDNITFGEATEDYDPII